MYMATLTVTNLNLTFTGNLTAVTINPEYIKNKNYNLGVAYYTTNTSGAVTGNTTIGTIVYAKNSDLSYNTTSFDFIFTMNKTTVTFTMTSESSGVVDITSININNNPINIQNTTVSSCELSYFNNTSGTGYEFQYYSSSNDLIGTDTVTYTKPNNVATYTYDQTVSNDTLLYFDTLMLGTNAIYDALAGSKQVIPEYAGFIDLSMAGFDNLSQ